jgi:(p)ppGpp synthase/HD superfamily hydrolase
VVYLFWPETARLSLEEVAQNFGDEVAVHIHDVTDQEKNKLDDALLATDKGKLSKSQVVEADRVVV